MILNCFFA